jgi:ATP-dependent protease HslVU (ClpYQ) peptidase subunit
MSIIVVVRKNGVAAIGADTLTKLGYTKESKKYIRNHSKMIRVGTSVMAYVGHASWGLVLDSYFSRTKPIPKLDSSRAIFEVARDLHKTLKDDYYLNPVEEEDDPFESTQGDFLIANKHGIFGLYSLRSVQEYTRFYAFGSGYKFALGAMRVAYKSLSSAKAIAQAGLEAACDFDDGSGLPCEIKSIKLVK